jgi:uncharacterized membrane protein YeaQ/YmgE (transglycosylase-associated protein family)
MTLENFIVLFLVAAVCGFVAERIAGGRLPFGLLGAIACGLIGSWLLVEMLHWRVPGDMTAGGVPVLTGILGAAAVIFVAASLSKAKPAARMGRRSSDRYNERSERHSRRRAA